MNKTLSLVDIFDDERDSQPVGINPVPGFMFIGELSSAVGVDLKTIRQFEREKL